MASFIKKVCFYLSNDGVSLERLLFQILINMFNKDVSIFLVRRSRTLDLKTYTSNQVPVRSRSTNVVTSIAQKSPPRSPFDDSFVDYTNDKHISNQEDVRIHLSTPNSQTKQDNSTQIPPNSILLHSPSKSPTSSSNLTFPDISNLVSPRPSLCSTPGHTGSEFEHQDYNDQLSDESWGTYILDGKIMIRVGEKRLLIFLKIEMC